MTCIIGYTNGKNVWMGGDSAGTSKNMNQRIRADKKVFIKKEFIIGFCGSFRLGDLLKHTFMIPALNQIDPDSFMVNQFVDSLRECLDNENKKAGYVGDNKLFPSILVGLKGHLYNIQSDYQCGRPEDNYDSIGSGSGIALGSMYGSKLSSNLSPNKRIETALEAAARNDASVRAPFHILKI